MGNKGIRGATALALAHALEPEADCDDVVANPPPPVPPLPHKRPRLRRPPLPARRRRRVPPFTSEVSLIKRDVPSFEIHGTLSPAALESANAPSGEVLIERDLDAEISAEFAAEFAGIAEPYSAETRPAKRRTLDPSKYLGPEFEDAAEVSDYALPSLAELASRISDSHVQTLVPAMDETDANAERMRDEDAVIARLAQAFAETTQADVDERMELEGLSDDDLIDALEFDEDKTGSSYPPPVGMPFAASPSAAPRAFAAAPSMPVQDVRPAPPPVPHSPVPLVARLAKMARTNAPPASVEAALTPEKSAKIDFAVLSPATEGLPSLAPTPLASLASAEPAPPSEDGKNSSLLAWAGVILLFVGGVAWWNSTRDNSAELLAAANEAVRNEAAANEAVRNEASANEASANEASANEASANEASANEASANEASANEASANEAAANEAAANEAAANEAAASEAAANEAAGNEAAANEAVRNEPAERESSAAGVRRHEARQAAVDDAATEAMADRAEARVAESRRDEAAQTNVAAAREASPTPEDNVRTAARQSEVEAEPATDVSDLPAQPSRENVQAALTAVRAAVRQCMPHAGRVPVSVTFRGRTGRAARAQVVEGQFTRQPMGGCIARAVRGAQVPPFQDDRLTVVYPFSF